MSESKKPESITVRHEGATNAPNPPVSVLRDKWDLVTKKKDDLQIVDRLKLKEILEEVGKAGNPHVELVVLRQLAHIEQKFAAFQGHALANTYIRMAQLQKEVGENPAASFAGAGTQLGFVFIHDSAAQYYEKALQAAGNTGFDDQTMDRILRSSRREFDAARDAAGSSRMFVRHCEFRRRTGGVGERIGFGFLKVLANYGESPLRVALNAALVIVLCSAVYFFVGISSAEGVVHSYPASLYFSVVTFTTLGYGDFAPLPGLSRTIASLEALSGLVLSSLFLVTLVRRYGR